MPGFGPLQPDADGILDLPDGFRYRVISRVGQDMDDGFVVPGLADGMHAFPAARGRTILVRNHELHPGSSETAFRAMKGQLSDAQLARIYDPGAGRGGVTTVVVDTASGTVEGQFLTLSGTLRNCAGGATPWGSWISCEEMVIGPGQFGARREHGYNFEVPAAATGLVEPLPLKAMGRFNHEAVAVDARTGVVYQTEDRGDGLLYRFLPQERGRLAAGGRLQALVIRDLPGVHTGNRRNATIKFPLGGRFLVDWVDVDDVTSPNDDLRRQGRSRGAAVFVRGEGMTVEVQANAAGGGTCIWFVCTSGGPHGLGQLWCYRPAAGEGGDDERRQPGTIELAVEPRNTDLLRNGDNITVTPFGDLLVCEDNAVAQHLVGITASGGMYRFAANARRDSEFAGATFSADGSTLFVNLYQPGLTFAIKGPWNTRRDAG
ncbi:MAG: PhoX family phosphatase [Gammaproteobacteria bacterium]|nr:MAG: PhoX family phosphatase [Gammaproteobacteria bacterium]